MSLGISVHRNLDELVSAFAADFAAVLHRTRTGLVVLSTSPISLAVVDRLVHANALGTVAASYLRFVASDESYPPVDPLLPTNRSILTERFLTPLSIDSSRLRSFDPSALSTVEECRSMDVYLETAGPALLYVGEIDASGRIGQVQPGTPYGSRCHIACIPDRADSADILFGKPQRTPCAMTLGLHEFSHADRCLVAASGAEAGASIRQSLTGLVSEELPCGVLRFCRSVHLLLDEAAGRALGDDLLRRFAVDTRDSVTEDLPPPFFAG